MELGTDIDEHVNARVLALADRLDVQGAVMGFGRPVPAYASLLVPFEPDSADVPALQEALRVLANTTAAVPPAQRGRSVDIPVRYGGDDGPDLDEVAERTGLTAETVIGLHAGHEYRVFMLGFAPGFAYLGPLAEALRLPRRAEPRLRVPAGSVAIAGAQTGIYPHSTAGGWHLIGRTDVRLWDGGAESPSLLLPGDRVRFVAA